MSRDLSFAWSGDISFVSRKNWTDVEGHVPQSTAHTVIYITTFIIVIIYITYH